MTDALDELIKRLQNDQDDHPRTQSWWPNELRKRLRRVYKDRQDALEVLYRMRAEREGLR